MRALLPVLLSAVVLAPAACAPRASDAPKAPGAAQAGIDVAAIQLDDAGFAAATLAVVKDPTPSPRRLGLLVGVVRRQLARAAHYFALGHEADGLEAVRGALYLVRVGEFRPEMI